MLKRFFMITFVLFFVFSGKTMATKHGVKIGLNYSNTTSGNKWKMGYNIGFVKNFEILTKIDIQAEILYSTKGSISTQQWTDEVGNDLGTFDLIFNYGYIEIPALAKYNFNFNEKNALGFFIGPHISILTNAYNRFSDPDKLGIRDKKYDIRDTNDIDYGIIVGLDYQFSISKVNLFFDLRYSTSLNSISKSGNWESSHHRLISASMGLKF